MTTTKPKSPARFKLGRQSSLAPESRTPTETVTEDEDEELAAAAAGIVDPTIRLMYLANEGDIDGITKMLNSGTNVDYRDIDGRTALHVAACQGRTDVVQLLLSRGAKVNSMDRWGSTPLADAVYYKNHDVIQLLEKHGAKPTIPPMHVLTDREVPEYEIHPTELDLSNSVKISKGTFHKASWRGIDVAVKTFGEEMFSDEDKVNAFRDELQLLQKIRHPNVVQFLGAVTQSNPMMIVTEYLPKGDLRQYLDRKGALMPAQAVKFALEIARGMNYLHEHKPEAIIHCDLEPPNILRDNSGHLKVADFGVSKLLVVKKTVKKDRPVTSLDSSLRYMAPEVYRNEEYDTKVDVFSFALILQEMIEGYVPFHLKEETEVPKAYVEGERPPFNAPAKSYPFGLRELIQECWDNEASKRPTFREIISVLELTSDRIARKMSWKVRLGKCLPRIRLFTKRDYVNPSSSRSSITREYTRNVRSVDIRKCCPFPGEFTGEFIQSLLPPLTVAKFRWWSHELISLHDPKPAFRQTANAEESRQCKKRSIGETTTNDDLVLHKKNIKTKKLEDYKVYNCEEQARERAKGDGECSRGIKERPGVMSSNSPRLVSQDCDSEFQTPRTLKVAKRKICSVRSLGKSSIDAPQCERQVRFSLQLCCSQMNRLSLCSASEDQPPKVLSNDKTSEDMLVESRKLDHARAKSGLSCLPGPHLSLERIKDALDLERKRHLAPNQSSVSTSSEIHYRSCSSSFSQPVSLLNQSPFDPLLVEEAILDLPLNLQGELVEANCSSRSAAVENDVLQSNLVDLSSGRKHSAEPALAIDVGRPPVYNEKQYKYYPARLGLDETFTENAFFISDANDGECGHTINLPKQEALNQNLSSRHMVATPDGLCLDNTQSTMRLMGKDVSVKTGYSEGERIIPSDASIDYSFLESYAQQSWLWRTTTLGESHSITSLDKSWNTTLLCDTSKDHFPMFCEPPQVRTYVVPDSELPPTVMYPCGSLVSCPLTDKDLYFHESGLGQQLNSVTFSHEQLPFLPEIGGLPSAYRNNGVVGLLPDVREPSFGIPFTSTTQSQLHWPQSSFDNSRFDMSSISPSELN
ncbi:BnaA09g55320D [Brassica napus]|uniref:BnaA09g55320D protein n=1 Tax=Brassica napus TaxID=3708 RepID=A0A078IJJ9_BRANA|nr:BnaA09g55320D [Brassica napus]